MIPSASGAVREIAEPLATPPVAHAPQAAHHQRVVIEGLLGLDQRLELLVVLRRRQPELLGDRRFLRLVLGPPRALEIEQRLFELGQCHGTSVARRDAQCKDPQRELASTLVPPGPSSSSGQSTCLVNRR